MDKENLMKKAKYAIAILAVLAIIFLIFQQMNASKKLLENEREALTQEIEDLKLEMLRVKGVTHKTRVTRDSLFTVLKPYTPYETMVKSLAQRDSIKDILPLNYGDLVMVLPDSTKGIVEGIVFGGNQYETYVKYKILLKGQKYQEVNPTQVVLLGK